jgi:hypothetical protein
MSIPELIEVAIARAAGSQMVQPGFGLRERHFTGCDSPENLGAGTANALRIWKFLEQPTTQCVESPLLFLCGISLIAQNCLAS